MRLGFFAFNTGPGKMMARLAEAAKAKKVETVLVPPLGNEVVQRKIEELRRCQAVLLGVSSEYDEETAVARELGREVPMFVVEDYPRNSLAETAPLRGAAPIVRGIFTARPGYEAELAAYGYHPDGIVHVGPPAHWQDDLQAFREARRMRREGRVLKQKTAGAGDACPVLPTDRVLYVSGAKNIVREIELIAELVRIFRNELDRTVIHYRGHPGEPGDWKRNGHEEEYANLLAQMNTARGKVWSIANTEMLSPSDPSQRAVADAKSHGSADISLAHPGATAWNWLGYEGQPGAVMMPLIWDTAIDYEKSPAVEGVASVVRTMTDVRHAIAEIGSPHGAEALRRRQRAFLHMTGDPIDWNTAPKVIGHVLQWLQKNA